MVKVKGGFTRALQRMDEINAAKAQIEGAIKRGQQMKQQIECCDWGVVGEIKNPHVVKPAEIPYVADWEMLGKVEVPKEPEYHNIFG